MRSNQLLMRLDLLKQLEIQQKELEAQIEAIKDSIKAEMTAHNTDEIFIGTYSVSWKSYTSHRFDSSAFKAEHGDLYKQYTKTIEAKRFILK